MNEIALSYRTPDGAGLPRFERLFLKHVALPRARRAIGWSAARARFFQAGHQALDVVDGLPEELLAQPARIARLPGLEPRSCDYSLADTVEHLARFADLLADLLPALARGERGREESIEGLKPRGMTPRDAIAGFRAALSGVERVLDAQRTVPASRATRAHPWYGEFDAHAWLVLGALHQRLHLTQLRRIAAALGVPRRHGAPELGVDWLEELND